MAVAWWAKDSPLVFDAVFQFAGIFSGAKLGSMLFAFRHRSGHPAPVVLGMVASAATMVAIVLGTRASAIRINWPWYPAIGTAVCYGVTRLLSSGRGRPLDRDVDTPAPDEQLPQPPQA